MPGFLTRTPMCLDDPGKAVHARATDIGRRDPRRLQVDRRDRVTVPDGSPFKAENVRATVAGDARSAQTTTLGSTG